MSEGKLPPINWLPPSKPEENDETDHDALTQESKSFRHAALIAEMKEREDVPPEFRDFLSDVQRQRALESDPKAMETASSELESFLKTYESFHLGVVVPILITEEYVDKNGSCYEVRAQELWESVNEILENQGSLPIPLR